MVPFAYGTWPRPNADVPLKECLPLTPNGKIDQEMLEKIGPQQPSGREDQVAPRNPIESRLVEIWKEVLKIESLGVHDNFFNLGGHSLLATKVIARLRQGLELDIPLRTLFEQPTVEQLAQDLNIRLTAAFPDEAPEVGG